MHDKLDFRRLKIFQSFILSRASFQKKYCRFEKKKSHCLRALVRILKVLARKIFLLMDVFEIPPKIIFCHVPLKTYWRDRASRASANEGPDL